MYYRSTYTPRFSSRVLQVRHRSCRCRGIVSWLSAVQHSRLIMLRVCASQLRLAAPQASRTSSFLAPSACPCRPKRWPGAAPDLLRPASKRNRSFSAPSSRLVTMAAAATLYDFQAKVRPVNGCYPICSFAAVAESEVMLCSECYAFTVYQQQTITIS
jgi:hypothetical protein